jgi:hypothetical protein
MFYTILILILSLILPGFLLCRILKILPKSDFLDKFVLSFAISFIWNIFICLIGLLTKLNINELMLFYFTSLILLVLLWLILNKFRLTIFLPEIKIDNIKENFLWLIPIVLTVFAIVIARKNGAIFEQESFFHLAIIKKTLSGQELTTTNLNYIGTSIFHPVYSFPLWHIFLALLAKICGASIFQIWQATIVPLSIFTFAVWSWLLKNILPTKNMAAICLSFFIVVIATFNQSYLLERLMIPNTLGLFILVPLLFGLALKYIFESEKNISILIIFWLTLFLTSIVHNLQFIYFGLIFTVFTLWLNLFSISNINLKIPAKRAWQILIFYFIVAISELLLAQNFQIITLKNAIDTTLTKSYSPVFNNLFIFSKITFIFFPLLFLVIKKYPKIIFPASLFSILPLIYFAGNTYLSSIILNTFGQIFLDRLNAYVTWDFLIWSILVTFFLSFADNVLNKLNKWIPQINIILILILIGSIILQLKFHTISNIYNSIFLNSQLTSFINNFYWILLLGVILIIFLIYIWQIKFNIENLLLKKIDHKFSILLLTSIIMFFFLSPIFNSDSSLTKRTHQKIEIEYLGGQNTVDFINKNISPKSRLLAATTTSDYLPLLTDNFMTTYPRSAKEEEINQFFIPDINYNEKLNLIIKFKIEYILITPEIKYLNEFLEQNPNTFKKIYSQNQTTIYKIK